MVGRVLLRKLVLEFSGQVDRIVIIDTHSRGDTGTGQKWFEELITRDVYFQPIKGKILGDLIQLITMDNANTKEG